MGMTAKTLMIQGTGSGVGKSAITAALCRIFYREGQRVAPFKAQNMSLNAHVTAQGGEMGRAQAYQAEACGIEPIVAMNPILLKPSADNCSQIIVMGKAVDTCEAKSFYRHHAVYKQEVQKAFQSLSERYELIVLEGAGSPAEINLKQWDLVNMPMAKMADAPVILVGDIDHGGVFAWMKGTYDLLDEDEKQRVRGFIINKFRGDLSLLQPGLDQFEKMVGKPILGVIPYMRDLMIDEEDGIVARAHPAAPSEGVLDVAVIWYPRISNFTDVTPLAADPNVSLRYVGKPEELGSPDLIVLPGSKNTLEDLRFLIQSGIANAVLDRHRCGALVLGICGGYQMMGTRVMDPEQMESSQKEMQGLNLFDMETTLQKDKITRQVEARTLPGLVFDQTYAVKGYEIHMGNTLHKNNYSPLFENPRGEEAAHLGTHNSEGTLLGTYVHGLLDQDDLREAFLDHVRNKRKVTGTANKFDYKRFREAQLDRLANTVEESLDMEQIKHIVLGEPRHNLVIGQKA
jgi:adenosylcobyric acid synthase